MSILKNNPTFYFRVGIILWVPWKIILALIFVLALYYEYPEKFILYVIFEVSLILRVYWKLLENTDLIFGIGLIFEKTRYLMLIAIHRYIETDGDVTRIRKSGVSCTWSGTWRMCPKREFFFQFYDTRKLAGVKRWTSSFWNYRYYLCVTNAWLHRRNIYPLFSATFPWWFFL